jgi:uncharacterized protein
MIVTTDNSNSYYLSLRKKELLILPAKFEKVMRQFLKTGNPDFEKEDQEMIYYSEKFKMLKTAGYFDEFDIWEHRNERYSEKTLRKAIANSSHIVFETTECCNLKCKYCGYGEYYSTFGVRKKKILTFDIAKHY